MKHLLADFAWIAGPTITCSMTWYYFGRWKGRRDRQDYIEHLLDIVKKEMK